MPNHPQNRRPGAPRPTGRPVKYRIRSNPQQRKRLAKGVLGAAFTGFSLFGMVQDFARGSSQVDTNAREAKRRAGASLVGNLIDKL